ncbi:NAD-P-binding protein [Panus rudis PR-1116 ss-1]|nr:NAD-P-binding protein [Panus rudis PR-1116 ss-1]
MGVFNSKAFDPLTDLPDLSGKVVIVTGGNRGIGYHTVRFLALRGAKVYLAARSEEKGRAAIEQLRQEVEVGEGEGEYANVSGMGNVEFLELDLSDPKSAKRSAEEFLEREGRLDVLVNNGAILYAPYTKTAYDIQDVMVVNHLSTFGFTTTLLPLLRETAKLPDSDVRIITLSSEAHRLVDNNIRFRGREDFNDEHASMFSPESGRYGRSKLANVLFTRELQRRFDAEGVPIIALSLHPGGVKTDGWEEFTSHNTGFLKFFYTLLGSTFVSPDKGAYTPVFAAAASQVRQQAEKYKGAYLMPPGKVVAASKPADSEELAKELWDTSESLLKEIEV